MAANGFVAAGPVAVAIEAASADVQQCVGRQGGADGDEPLLLGSSSDAEGVFYRPDGVNEAEGCADELSVARLRIFHCLALQNEALHSRESHCHEMSTYTSDTDDYSHVEMLSDSRDWMRTADTEAASVYEAL